MAKEFDEYAEDYDEALDQGLAISGEDKEYFARGRIAWVAGCLRELRVNVKLVMDFGCGTGSSSPLLLEIVGANSFVGVEQSPKLLERARRSYGSDRQQFLLVDQYAPSGGIDLVFSNGVFHHIPILERAAAINYIYRSLRQNGFVALWENNPWNPGTRYVMSRIPFDRDAIPLNYSETHKLLRDGGFRLVRTDFLFIFPRMLRCFRWIEPFVSRLPLGTQYMVLGQKY